MRAIMRGPSPLPPARLVMVDTATARTCFDKGRMYGVARDLGIRVPGTESGVTPAGLVEAARRCGFPCVLKTNDSSNRLLGEKALICTDEAAVVELASAPLEPDARIVVQSFAPGHRVNCNFAAWHGELRVYNEHRVIRTDRPNGTGYTVDAVSIPPTPTLRRHTEAFARHFTTRASGAPNISSTRRAGRSPSSSSTRGSMPLARCRSIAVAICRSGRSRSRAAARAIVSTCHCCRLPHRCARQLAARGSQGPAQSSRARIDGAPPTLIWLGRAARSFLAADCHAVWSWRDPGPALYWYLGVQRKRAPVA